MYDNPTMVASEQYDLVSTSIDSTWSLGGGFGFYVSKNVRADFTYDHRFSSNANGSFASSAATGSGSVGLSSDLLLANAYYDFDSTSRFSPYLGVGLGLVRHSVSSATISDCGCGTITYDSAENWHVAGAVMAGVTYTMSDRLKLDAGYRFLYLGEADTGSPTTNAGGFISTSSGISISDIHAHEFRVGLRYDFK